VKTEALLSAFRLLSVREAMETVCNSGNDREVGRRALLLAYTIDPSLIGTQRELARRMGVTEARVSQMLKVLRRHFSPKSGHRLTTA
jgi:DNA-binding MarR family transcriptional regulator